MRVRDEMLLSIFGQRNIAAALLLARILDDRLGHQPAATIKPTKVRNGVECACSITLGRD
jgi:hypothetical protein